MRLSSLLLLLSCGLLAAAEPAPVEIRISVAPGLKFDTPRFAVAPGAAVTVKFSNPDQMIHNFVITLPGARIEVVMAALALGAEGPAKNFIPDSKKILWATKALNPGEKTELTFTAPRAEGVYPYVCTSMGHGIVMYGAMYVTTQPLPPLEADPNVPPVAVAVNDASDLSHTTLDKTVISRTFMPDAGPAAIVVGMAGGQSYCFDAGLCRLRYAWKGGFVDNTEHWIGKGDVQAKAVGHIYYRAPAEPVIRLGHAGNLPAARWQGYSWANGSPTFHYTLDGDEVRETPQPLTGPEAGAGVIFTYEIDSKGETVYFLTDPEGGATFASSAGEWKDGILTLSPVQAKHFTLTMKERPGVEPLLYLSLNDAPLPGKKLPPAGVLGRAFAPGGEAKKKVELPLGVGTDALKQGGTLMAWVKLNAASSPQPVFSAAPAPEGLLLTAPGDDTKWHHLAWIVADGGKAAVYRDGEPAGSIEAHLPAKDGALVLGSAGKTFLNGLLDEVRIYDRALSAEDIQKIYRHEAASLTGNQN
jgi:azurin